MFISAATSFILYLLIFFRLRGNVTLSAGYKIGFHRRPKVRFGRTGDGTYVVTDDPRVKSHLTQVAKHMLWYPLAFTVLVLPNAASRFSSFSGTSVPFPVIIATAAVFMLHGFVNTLLFCTTRNILPGSWRQRFGLGTTWDSGRGDVNLSTRTNATWRFTGFSTARMAPIDLSTVVVEKSVEIQYDEAQPNLSYIMVGSPLSPSSPTSPTSPTPLLRAYGDGGRPVDTKRDHTRHLSFFTPRDASSSIRTEVDGDDQDSEFSVGVDPALKAKTIESETPPRPLGHALSGHESGSYPPTPGLQAPASIHLFLRPN